jgi:hypothetical protein
MANLRALSWRSGLAPGEELNLDFALSPSPLEEGRLKLDIPPGIIIRLDPEINSG